MTCAASGLQHQTQQTDRGRTQTLAVFGSGKALIISGSGVLFDGFGVQFVKVLETFVYEMELISCYYW